MGDDYEKVSKDFWEKVSKGEIDPTKLMERRQELPWAYCSRHGVRYPRGEQCPVCKRGD